MASDDPPDLRPRRPRGAAAPLAFLLLAGALAACTDGYPTEDEPLVEPSEMTQSQRVDALNAIGKSADPEARWRYSLSRDCVLDVEVSSPGQAVSRSSIRMDRPWNAELRRERGDEVFEVLLTQLQPPGAPGEAQGAPPVRVAEASQRIDALLALALLRAVLADCRPVAGQSTGDSTLHFTNRWLSHD